MCGVVGLIGTPEASREAFLALTTLQHRGQDAAGILTYDATGFHRVKNLGLVESVFTRENMETLTGSVAIGHARYSTVGRGDTIDVQPFLLSYPFGLGMVHNGNIVNHEELKQDLRSKGKRHLLTQSDTEIVLNLLAQGLISSSSEGQESELGFEQICSAVNGIFEKVVGSYSIVTMIADHGLVAFRDPNGIRPMIWGSRPARRGEDGGLPSGESHAFASESVALSFLGYETVRSLEPGEVVFIDFKGQVHSKVLAKRKPAPCMFEWVYFASPESVIDDVPVYGSRINLGKRLAGLVREKLKNHGVTPDLIVPVPETSRIAAIALAEELKIPYREVLIKNRYIKRTFILDSEDKRQKAVSLKLSPVKSELAGKTVVLVDDSIVRGTTSQKIIQLVRQAGAEKVYFVSTCPPIKNPCYYGIDFPSSEELIGSGKSIEEIERVLGADGVVYQDLEGLETAIREAGPADRSTSPCMACLNGDYPTDISSGQGFGQRRRIDRNREKKA